MTKSLLILSIIFTISIGRSQEIVKVSQPSLFVNFEAAQQLGDSIVRYYLTSSSTENASNDHLIVAEFDLRSNQIMIDTLHDSESGYLLMKSAFELYTLGMPDGSVLLASNNFECDITYSELVYLDKSGKVDWLIDPYDLEFSFYNIKSIGLVKKDIFAIEHDGAEPWKYFDQNGIQRFFEFPSPVYYNTFKLNNYWFGTLKDEVVKLNDSFDAIDYYKTDSILFLVPIHGGRLLGGSNEGIFILDSMLNELAYTDEIINSNSGDASQHAIWITTNDGIYELDEDLMLNTFHSFQPRESVHDIRASGEQAYIASIYHGELHRDLVIREYAEDSTLSSDILDLSITSVRLPDEIIRLPYENVPFFYTLRFDSIFFTIYNNSADTIRSFNINFDWDTEYWCTYITGEWNFDDLELLPYDSIELRLDSFVTDLIVFHVRSPFCFWVDYPNRATDIDPSNNEACATTDIISSMKVPEESQDILVSPNPAVEKINLYSSNHDLVNEVSIYNPGGIQVYKKIDCLTPCEIPIHELSQGIYWIKVVCDRNTQIKTFVKL